MLLRIPKPEISDFANRLTKPSYFAHERSYKVAVHKVIAKFLAPETLDRADFGDVARTVFGDEDLDLRLLGVTDAEKQIIQDHLAASELPRFRQALANLSGGKWGLVQFAWIPRAIDFGLASAINEAFRALVAKDPLPARVDRFRQDLYAIQKTLQDKGGFLPNWHLLSVSLNFVASILGAYDPTQYVFYSYSAIRKAFSDFGATWPKGSAGTRYDLVCKFMHRVDKHLRDAGVSVTDLIDAQSFVWIRFSYPPNLPPDVAPNLPPDVARDLADATYWPLERAQRLIRMADKCRPLLFQGPPGTSKTFVAQTLARLMTEEQENNVEIVQFHPSYAYEDFIEGIRPRITRDTKGLEYELRDGIFLELADRAKQQPEARFVLIVDEINRANLPRVLGELLYALEYRGQEHSIRLPYSGRETFVPKNILVIGTMNLADRSVGLVDAALRRRFQNFEFSPDSSVLKKWLAANKLGSLAETAAERLDTLNKRLQTLLDSDRLIGHTYLMRSDLQEVGFEAVWMDDIEPLLREHLHNRPGDITDLRETFLHA